MPVDPFIELANGVLDDGPMWETKAERAQLAELPAEIERNGNAWPDSVRAYALRVWAFDAGRNAEKTARILRERAEIGITAQTIRNWVVRDDWAGRAETLHQTFVPTSNSAIRAGISAAAVRSVGVLDELQMNEDIPASVRAKAAQTLLGIAGFVPAFNGPVVNVAIGQERGRLAAATDDELAQMIEAYGSDNTPDTPPHEASYTELRLAKQARDGHGHYAPEH